MAEKTIEKVISPDEKTVFDIFNNNKSYFIDIYQRDYKWGKVYVDTLLQDIELRFELGKREQTDPNYILKDVTANFEPYFLNTFLTHNTSSNTYIVDGQQRLTTFLLILIKIYCLLKDIKSDNKVDTKAYSPEFISKLIFETNPFGETARFKIHNENREAAFKAILDNDLAFQPTDQTQKNIVINYEVISKWYNAYFIKDNEIDRVKLNYYISYIINKLVIIEIEITKPNDVPMIFEVVNDRGMGLKPYEILKGKIIGILEDANKENANNVWINMQNAFYRKGLDIDEFFKMFFRAKFANSELDYKKFEDKYHYEIYRNDSIKKYFGNFRNKKKLYDVLINDINYFANLYIRLKTDDISPYVNYNKLLEQDQQFLLLMSCITYSDKGKDQGKIDAISKKFDQFHSTLRLLDLYESSMFQTYIHILNKGIRNKGIDEAYMLFDKIFISALEILQVIEPGKYSKIEDVYEYERFKNIYNRWLNFSKYVFLRVEIVLSQLLKGKPSYVVNNMSSLEHIFNKTNRKTYALHLEHMYARNEKNNILFTDTDDIFDERLFYSTRNKLGAVLLLKDSHNISSGNDIYADKLAVYSKSDIIWNQILVGHINDIDLKKLPEGFSFKIQKPDTNGLLPLSAIDERQKELFILIKYIWSDTFKNIQM
ncbi:MAG: hypothetical protein FD174_621 [Geobacteraceae bacterium]|nr:MAG: hypothetical protein FD174_621 [Geobacteraceae bacterium]